MRAEHAFTGKLWRHPGAGGWHFVTLPVTTAARIREAFGTGGRGWGSVRVEATLGATTWATSIFPDAKAGSYLLPVKREVRDAERVSDGARVKVGLVLER